MNDGQVAAKERPLVYGQRRGPGGRFIFFFPTRLFESQVRPTLLETGPRPEVRTQSRNETHQQSPEREWPSPSRQPKMQEIRDEAAVDLELEKVRGRLPGVGREEVRR